MSLTPDPSIHLPEETPPTPGHRGAASGSSASSSTTDGPSAGTPVVLPVERLQQLLKQTSEQQTNVLEVMRAQSKEFYSSLLDHNSRQEKDPKFPTYDGNPANFLSWLLQVDQIRKDRELTDSHALKWVKSALGGFAFHFDGVTFSNWEDFARQAKARFLPADIDQRLLSELQQMRMIGSDFHSYYLKFRAYQKHLPFLPEELMLCAFIQGLEPNLQYAVSNSHPRSVEEAYSTAWGAHHQRPPPWMPYMETLYQQMLQQTHGQLEQFSQEAGRYIRGQVQQYTPTTPTATPATSLPQLDALSRTLMPTQMQARTYGPNPTIFAPSSGAPVQLSAPPFLPYWPPGMQGAPPMAPQKQQSRSSSDSGNYRKFFRSPARNVRCYKCERDGHYASSCQSSSPWSRRPSFPSRNFSFPVTIPGTETIYNHPPEDLTIHASTPEAIHLIPLPSAVVVASSAMWQKTAEDLTFTASVKIVANQVTLPVIAVLE